MTFSATVLRVLIASPGDTVASRQVVKEAIEDWNSLNAEETGLILLPVLWERDATPEMGDRPQQIINRQLVDAADLLIGLFWTRLGTPTAEADSGTVEEIERCIDADKPVLLYFSDVPVVPDSVDPEEYKRLRAFKKDMQGKGLYDTYSSEDELRRKINAALTRTVREAFADVVGGPEAMAAMTRPDLGEGPHASLLARIEREREVRGFNKSGRPQYRTRERLIIENHGSASAENLRFETVAAGDPDDEPPHVMGPQEPVRKLPPGGSIDYPMATFLGSAAQWDVVFRWEEDGEEYTERQSMR